MKLSAWAKKNGITYKTAWTWFKNNKLPATVIQTSTGTILVDDSPQETKNNITAVDIYARVSSHDKKIDLNNQIKLCEDFCTKNGWIINNIYKEIASGMNDNRKQLNKIFNNPPNKLIILYKDRLTRFGFNYINELLKSKNCELIVINPNKTEEEDLLKDFIAVITSFCCRLYGARRGQSKALKIKSELK